MSKTFSLKKIIAMTLVIIMAISVFLVLGTSAASAYTDYSTKRFDVDVKVQKDNSYIITETIVVDFNGHHHGIFRNIPEDWGKMKIDKVSVKGDPYEFYTEDDNYVIQIGDANKTVTGKQKYTIKYRMRIFEDRDTAGDFLYLDLIPTYWETPIKSSTVTMTMPNKAQTNNIAANWKGLKLYVGKYKNTDVLNANNTTSDRVSYRVDTDTNKLVINAKDLPRGFGITAKMDLTEGYWVDPMNNNWTKLPLVIILIAIPLLCFLMWLKFGRDPKIVKTVEFYAPEGVTPAELGYIIDGSVENNDMVSMIIYFAYKKYLSINEYKKKKFELTKLREIDGDEKRFARILFNGLFDKADQVRLDDLDEDFGDQFLASKDALISYYSGKKKRLFSVGADIARIIGCLLMMVPVIASICLSALYSLSYVYIAIAIPAFILIVAGMLLFLLGYDRKDSMKKGSKTTLYIIGIVMSILALLLSVVSTILLMDSLIMGIGLLASSIITFMLVVLMRARTKRGAELQGKVLGFKDFIKKAEIDKLKMLVEEDPEYFYNVLPYAYVMGLSDKWAKNFENIPMTGPTWYYGYDNNTMFNVLFFSSMMNNCSRSFASNIQIPTGDGGMDGGGGFGGGGFSGGGFGGGGGGAW